MLVLPIVVCYIKLEILYKEQALTSYLYNIVQ